MISLTLYRLDLLHCNLHWIGIAPNSNTLTVVLFCFPETLNVPRGEAEGNIEGLGETKLAVSRGTSH